MKLRTVDRRRSLPGVWTESKHASERAVLTVKIRVPHELEYGGCGIPFALSVKLQFDQIALS